MKTQLNYSEFKELRKKNEEAQPKWLRGIEVDFEESTKFAYKLYLKGKVPQYAK